MPGSAPIIYWDSNVMLSYINEHPDRKPTIEALLEDSVNDVIEIVTSTLTIVEVAFAKAEKDTQSLDSNVEAKIDKLWFPAGPVRLVEFHRLIGQEARGLLRHAIATGQSLKPPDAIHLATAKQLGCAEFQTYNNKKLAHFSAEIGCPVSEPIHDKPKLPL